MVIRDKQELKRCVKQAVRRAQVTETQFDFNVFSGNLGVSELLHTWAAPAGAPNDALRRATASGTPFGEEAAAMFSALSALELPTHNLNNAQTIQESYERDAYLREVLDVMRARRVFVRIPMACAEQISFDDERFVPVLAVDTPRFFAPGRYGVDYKACCTALVQLVCGAINSVAADDVSAQALEYCLIPLSEDTGCVLHISVCQEDQVAALSLLKAHPSVRAIVSSEMQRERALIDLAADSGNVLVRISDLENMRYALSKLNTRFIPFSSCASLPELMLGRWEIARETIWQTLLDAYLPLARAGYELTSEAIAQDVQRLFFGNIESFYGENI